MPSLYLNIFAVKQKPSRKKNAKIQIIPHFITARLRIIMQIGRSISSKSAYLQLLNQSSHNRMYSFTNRIGYKCPIKYDLIHKFN